MAFTLLLPPAGVFLQINEGWVVVGGRGSMSASAVRGIVLPAHPSQMETNGGKVEAPQNKRRETVLEEEANQAKDKSEES